MYGDSLMLGTVLRHQSQYIGQAHIAMLGNQAANQIPLRQQSAFQQGNDILPARPVNVRFAFDTHDRESIKRDLFLFNFNDLDGAG